MPLVMGEYTTCPIVSVHEMKMKSKFLINIRDI